MARGAPEGIGPVGNLAPGPDPAQLRGRIVGLGPAVKFISDVLTPLGVARATAKQRVREHNDAEGFSIEGQSGGRQVRTDPPKGPSAWPMPPASGGPDPDDVRAAGAKKTGQENRAAYRRWMGTPGRPPREPWGGEKPFDEEYQPQHFKKPKAKPMDTTDIRRRSP